MKANAEKGINEITSVRLLTCNLTTMRNTEIISNV